MLVEVRKTSPQAADKQSNESLTCLTVDRRAYHSLQASFLLLPFRYNIQFILPQEPV